MDLNPEGEPDESDESFLGRGLCEEVNLPVLRYYDSDDDDGPEVYCSELDEEGNCRLGKVCPRFTFPDDGTFSSIGRLPGSEVEYVKPRWKRKNKLEKDGDFTERTTVGSGVCNIVNRECLRYFDFGDCSGVSVFCDLMVENGYLGGCTACGVCARKYPPDGPTYSVFKSN